MPLKFKLLPMDKHCKCRLVYAAKATEGRGTDNRNDISSIIGTKNVLECGRQGNEKKNFPKSMLTSVLKRHKTNYK